MKLQSMKKYIRESYADDDQIHPEWYMDDDDKTSWYDEIPDDEWEDIDEYNKQMADEYDEYKRYEDSLNEIVLNEGTLTRLIRESISDAMNIKDKFTILLDAWYDGQDLDVEDLSDNDSAAYDLEDFANQDDTFYSYFYNMLDFIKNTYHQNNPYSVVNEMIKEYVMNK